MIESGRPCAAVATASHLKQPSNATVLCYQHHSCLSGSHTHARMHSRSAESWNICHLRRGISSFPAQSQLFTLLPWRYAYWLRPRPPHARVQWCNGPLCADGIGNSVGVWCCCVTGSRDEDVVLTGQWTFSRSVIMSNSTLMSMHLLNSRCNGQKRGAAAAVRKTSVGWLQQCSSGY